ncbi:hypothetical protein [Phocaeicola dorei]|uniref:hypothetical protein n=1 Tax=Phocaeicola dorei TaxID=357276 RepID=UPI002E775B6E|nr:hypothetical protein [Phocaeicola dorei]
MNKKFLSAILFGALMVTSTGTFVSCKDYDDDIDSLNEKVDKLTKDLSELQAAAGKYVTAVKYDAATGKLTVTGGNGETFQLPMPAELPTYSLKVVDGKIQLLDGDKVVSEATLPTTDVPATFDPTLLKWNNGYLYYGDVKISGVEKPQSVGSITEVKDEETGEVIGYVIELDGKSATFSVVTDLKALVFEPELYYQGIEAIAVKSFVYKALTATDVNADADNKDDAPVKETVTTEVTPELSATYHMNPSTADVRNLVKEDLKFLAYDKEYARAADGVVVPEISKVEPKNGELTVWAKLTEGTIKDIANDNKVTVLALQANYLNGDNKRSVITSDYAAVKAVKITDLVLNNAKVAGENHLAVKAADAIQNAPEVKVAWDETVDLAEYVQTHYGAGDAHTKWDENAASGTVEKAGFSYSYELVGYIDGSNKTSQSAHAALKGSVLRPQLPKDGKAAEWGATEQNQATVGRMPLVRVFLNDNNSKKKVAVGYLKVEITGAPAEDRITATTEYTFNEEFTLSCRTEDWVQEVTWFQIEEQILAQLNISKEDFERSYIYDGPMIQYSEATLDAMPLTKLSTKVEQTEADVEGTMTEVLQWTIPANYAYEYFSANASMKAIVRYTKENKDIQGNVISNDYVYVTLTWTPNPRNVTPTGTLANSDKTKQIWFASNSNEGGSGYDEIHVNTEVPAATGHDIMRFNKFILDTFNGHDVTISEIASVYTDFADAELTKTFRFVDPKDAKMTGVSGTIYTLSVNADRTQLLASTPTIANTVIATITDAVDNNGEDLIALANNDIAKDLLNVAGRDALADNLTARLSVETVNECGKSLNAVANNEFDVKFLRPITVEADKMDNFKDGVDVGAEGSKIDLKLAFTDWRNEAFKIAPINYYTYYDVKSVTIDTKEAETTINGKYEPIPANLQVKYDGVTTEEIAKGNFGTLTYINNKVEVGEFDIKLPVVVEYAWGTVKFDIVCHVAKTVG